MSHREADASAQMPSARLAFDDVSHSFGSARILRDVSLSAAEGEVLCLLGPSGSGKTTLLRIAAGIERQSEGRVFLSGREVAGPQAFLPPEKRGVGLMFQDFALFPHLTVLDNVRFGLADLSRSASQKEAGDALERVGLAEAVDLYPHMLSGGQQQRVALARALAPRPAVLLMDEPFSGLDSRLRDTVRDDTLAVLREGGTTAVMVTHDAEEAMRMGDRIALLRDGRLVQTGKAEDLYRRPVDLFAAAFFSEINVIEGVARGGIVSTPLGSAGETEASDGTSMTVALRPSGLVFGDASRGVPARVAERRFLGSVDLATIVVAGVEAPLRVRLRAGSVPCEARDVVVSIDLQDVMVFERANDDRHL